VNANLKWVQGIIDEARSLDFRINSETRLIEYYISLPYVSSNPCNIDKNIDLITAHVERRKTLGRFKEDIKTAAGALKGKERQVFWLRYCKGVTIDDIVKLLKITKRMFSYYRERAFENIAKELKNMGYVQE